MNNINPETEEKIKEIMREVKYVMLFVAIMAIGVLLLALQQLISSR